MKYHTPCDGTQNLLEPYRHVRLNELHHNYKEACKQKKVAKEQEKKIKKKNLIKGWWEEPVIELDMDWSQAKGRSDSKAS